jgi:hypothetical protein
VDLEKESIYKSKKGKLGEMSLRGKDMLRGSRHSWALADLPVISASGLSDVDNGKNERLKWITAESFRYRLLYMCQSQRLHGGEKEANVFFILYRYINQY